MTNRVFYITLMIALVLVLGYLGYLIFKPFFIPIAWAVVLSILFYPLYSFVLKYLRWKSAASLMVLVVILIVILGPVSYLSFLLVSELRTVTASADAGGIEALKEMTRHPAIRNFLEPAMSFFNITEKDINRVVEESLRQWGQDLLGGIRKGIAGIITGFLDFIFMTISIFFLLKDGPEFVKRAMDYVPFSDEQKDILVKRIKDIVIATIYGGVVVAMVQGSAGGLAFVLLGISSPVIWGFAMAVASFLPIIGPFIIWMPAAVYLFLQGAVGKGIALVLIGALGISLIDNFLRPAIVGTRAKMPFLPLFFSVLGGIKAFGLIGFILGPLILAVFLSVIEVFRSVEEGGRF
jgi:predicted PurR-regulated permease PerM